MASDKDHEAVDTQAKQLIVAPETDVDLPVPVKAKPVPSAIACLLDDDSEGVVRRCFTDLGLIDGQVMHGGVERAIAELPHRGSPHFLVVDISGIADPLPQINRLAEVCNPETEVVVVGERNDIVLYRDLKAAGVAEYFYKPLVAGLLTRALAEIGSGARAAPPSRGGKLIFVLGARGGVGVTTIATNLAWYFAEIRQRGVLLLDLDLRGGDAALQLDSLPGHALREALADPTRIDDLFLERGVVSITDRLGLLAGLEPLANPPAHNEEAVLLLLQRLLTHYRYVVVDLPADIALMFPRLLHLPSTILLVSDASLTGIREVARWREFLGPNSPDRAVLHLLNKAHADGAMPDDEMRQVVPVPEISIRWDRDVVSRAVLGTKATQKSSAIRDGMAALALLLSGAAPEEARPLWKRMFG
jgi:pilus assembly protein CpaE